MSILLLGVGGGGGSILRSVKELFRRDVAIAQKTDPKYADRVRRAVTARFLDTNAFSLSDVPPEERLMIGARTTGAAFIITSFNAGVIFCSAAVANPVSEVPGHSVVTVTPSPSSSRCSASPRRNT